MTLLDIPNKAGLRGTAPGTMYVDETPGDTTRYYWIRFVNTLGQVGPFNAIAGTMGSTVADPAWLLEELAGQITESELYGTLNERINLIDTAGSGLHG
jgi:predicted phage tail protein